MQMTSGCAESSQRMTCGRRARIEFTFQVASIISNRHQEAADQCAPTTNIDRFDVFVHSVCTIAADSQSIEHRNTHRSQEGSVRSATNLGFPEIKVDIRCD